jgi:hypothetical protein
MNKKGYSTGFTWVFGLVTIFGLGILYIVFNQVFLAHLVPTVKDMVNNSYPAIDDATQVEINANIDKYMDFFHILPYILFFVVVIYMFIAAIRKEREGEYV